MPTRQPHVRSRRGPASAALLVALAPVCALHAQTPRPMVPEDVVSVRLASDVQLSPDGRTVAFVVEEAPREVRPGISRRAGVWLVASDGGEPRRVAPAAGDSLSGAWAPRWSPDGRSLAYLSDLGGAAQVHALAAPGATPATRRLTSAPAGVGDFAWSPDGSMIAYTAQDPPSPEARARAERSTAVVVGRDLRFTRLWTVGTGPDDSVPALATRDSLSVRAFAWSPDGAAFAVIAQPLPLPEYEENMDLVTVERRSGRIRRRLSTHLLHTQALGWSPDGRWISFLEAPAAMPYAWWLAVIAPDGEAARPLLREDTLSVLHAAWTPDSRLLAEIVEGTSTRLSWVNVARDAERPLAPVTASQGDYGFSTNGRRVAFLGQTTASPTDIWIAEPNGTTRRLTTLNPQVAGWRLGVVREVTWRNSRDGLLVRGVLVTPPGYVPGRRYPTVVQTHPGDLPWYVGWLGRWWSWGQLLASNGYVVFLPNYRGVTGQGYRLHMTLGDWGAGLQDLLDGVDSLVAAGVADPDALGIGGWSNGGFMAEWAITHTTRFRAAVAQSGHADFFALAGATGGYRMWGDLHERRTVYEAHSPITFIREARTPTLLLHGERDRGVPVTQGYAFYHGLRAMGVEAEMVVYPNEGHGVGSPANQADVNRRVLAWFDGHLRARSGAP